MVHPNASALTMITLTVNGTQYEADLEPDTPLLWALREAVSLTGTNSDAA